MIHPFPSPKSSPSPLHNTTMSPHKLFKTNASIPTINFSSNLFQTSKNEIVPVIPTAISQPIVPVIPTVTKEPLWKLVRKKFMKDMKKTIEKTERRVDKMTRLVEEREIAYEICDVMEGMLVRTVSKYSNKMKRKRIDEYEKRKSDMLTRTKRIFGQLNEKSSECCKVALWMSDMVANFSHSKRKEIDLVKRMNEVNHYPAMNWHAEVVMRSSGATSLFRRRDVYYHSPSGFKLRSRPDVFAFLTLFPEYKEAVHVKDGSVFELSHLNFSFNADVVSKFVPTRLASGREVYLDDDELKLLVRSHKKRRKKRKRKEVILPPKKNKIPLWTILARVFALEMKKARSEKILEKNPEIGDAVQKKINKNWEHIGEIVRVRDFENPYKKHYSKVVRERKWIVTTKLNDKTKVFGWNSDEYRIIVRSESEKKRRRKKKKRTSKKRKRIEKKEEEKVREEEEDQCGICLNSYSKNLGLPVSCSHVFCFECISKWTKITNSCPTCKSRFQKLLKVTTSKQHSAVSIPSARRKKMKLNAREDHVVVKDIIKIRKRNQRHVYYEDESVQCMRQSLECRVRLGDISSSRFCVQCDRCNTWFHGECVGFRSAQQISSQDPWYCPGCDGCS